MREEEKGMVIRPLDASGDILPVLRAGDMISGAEAAALLARHRLNLLSGEWWENTAWGNGILKMLQDDSIEYAETNLNLEDNAAIQNQWKRFKEVKHKRRRAYVKKL